MSGLDGLGWPNPEDEPKPKKTMNSQLEIKLATKMTDTPETDQAERESIAAYIESYGPDAVFPCDGYDHARKLERERDEAQERADTMFAKHVDILDQTRNERDEWKAKYIQQNKDLGCEMMDPNGTIWDYAKKVQRELTVVTKQRDQLEGRLRVELGGHPDSELWGNAGLIAATMRCVDALDAVTEQRDRLAAAVNAATVLIAAKGRHNTLLAYEGLRSALSPGNVKSPPTGATEKEVEL